MAITQADLLKFRADTPGTQDRIHLNNAGSSLPPAVVTEHMITYLLEESKLGGYEYHRVRGAELEACYDLIARMINANSHEVALLENATAAWNAAFQSIDFQDGDEVITNSCDYASNYLSYLNHDKKLVVKVIPDDSSGDPDLDDFDKMFSSKTKLVAITHMPTNGGLVNPVEQIGEITKRHGVLYLVDACQSAGQYPLDVDKIQCDFLSATGRKYLRAPRGTGFLYARQSALAITHPRMIDLHSAEWTGLNAYHVRTDARRYEIWEGNRAAQMGLKAAVAYANDIGLSHIWERVVELGQYLRDLLSDLPDVSLRDKGSIKGGIVSFNHDKYDALSLQSLLFERRINISWNGAANTYIDMTQRDLKEICRASVHYYNTKEELEEFVSALKELSK